MLEAHWSFDLLPLFLSITHPSSPLSLSHLSFSFLPLFPPTALPFSLYPSLLFPLRPRVLCPSSISLRPRRLMCCLGPPVVAADANADYHHNVGDSTRLVNRPGTPSAATGNDLCNKRRIRCACRKWNGQPSASQLGRRQRGRPDSSRPVSVLCSSRARPVRVRSASRPRPACGRRGRRSRRARMRRRWCTGGENGARLVAPEMVAGRRRRARTVRV